jgi:colanic acid biosynthesis glycosyl transferase WcaI
MTDNQDKKSILLFSPFFYPENISSGRYNSHLALALRESGHEVVVVCSYPFYPEWNASTADVDELVGIETLRGGGRVAYPRSQVFRRLILEFWYFLFARKAVRFLDDRCFDLIVDIYPPNLFSLGLLRKRKLKAPVVGIVHDLQGVMSQSKPSLVRRIIGNVIRPIEKRSLERCDRLIFLSNESLHFALTNYGLDKGKCDVAYPFQSLSGKSDVSIPAALLTHEKSLVYSGALSEKQAPDDLLRLMDEFARRNNDYGVLIFSNGPVFDLLRARSASAGSRVEFHDLVPDDELEGLLRYSTIQIIPQKPSISHGAFPSKLPNLVATGTAVFGITDEGSEVDHILSQYSRGKTINSWRSDLAIAALEEFAQEVNSGRADPNHAVSDRKLCDLFSIERLCEHIWKAT